MSSFNSLYSRLLEEVTSEPSLLQLGFDETPNPKFTGNYYWTKGVAGNLYKSFFLGKFYVLDSDGNSVDSDKPVQEGMYVIDKMYPDSARKVVSKNGKLFLDKTDDKVSVPKSAQEERQKSIEAGRDKALKHFFPKD
jgi:hypothetical protein